MRVLNPHFDTVFKYLMEDLEIVKGLVEAIIKQEVVEIYPAPQESSSFELKIKYNQLPLQRQDFVAFIKSRTIEGKFVTEKVIIEVQKSYIAPAISRFRNYLSEKYGKKSILGNEQKYLPIKTIYLIQKTFNKNLPAVLGRKGIYFDVLEDSLYQGDRDEIVELFNHDSWFIQTRLLPPEFKDELMYVLSVFAPWFIDKTDEKYIVIPDDNILFQKHKLLNRILRRLEAATQNDNINRNLEMEIDYENYVDSLIEKSALSEKERNQAIAKAEEAEAKAEQAQIQVLQAALEKKIFKYYFIEKKSIESICKELNLESEFVKNIIS